MAAGSPLSYSSFRTYAECPLRWKFLYVEKRSEAPKGYFTFGRVIHSVLEQLVRPLVVPASRRRGAGEAQTTLADFSTAPRGAPVPSRTMTSEELLALYEKSWSSEGYLSAEDEARYKALGRNLLLRYRELLERRPPQPVSVEEHLETRWEGIPIHGYVDRIDRTAGGGLEVLDYKTSKELSREDVRESDQLAIYQVLVESNYREPVERLTLFHLRSLTPLGAPARPRRALEPLHARLGEVSDGIREEAFEPTPGRHCSRCEFQGLCPEFRPVPTTEQARLIALVDRFDALRSEERRLDGEMARTADELHRAAEELGLHRVRGSRSVAVRHREVTWQYPLERVRPILEESEGTVRGTPGSPDEVRRLVRDPSVPAELRRRLAETGSRRVRWYWELDDVDARPG